MQKNTYCAAYAEDFWPDISVVDYWDVVDDVWQT